MNARLFFWFPSFFPTGWWGTYPHRHAVNTSTAAPPGAMDACRAKYRAFCLQHGSSPTSLSRSVLWLSRMFAGFLFVWNHTRTHHPSIYARVKVISATVSRGWRVTSADLLVSRLFIGVDVSNYLKLVVQSSDYRWFCGSGNKQKVIWM